MASIHRLRQKAMTNLTGEGESKSKDDKHRAIAIGSVRNDLSLFFGQILFGQIGRGEAFD